MTVQYSASRNDQNGNNSQFCSRAPFENEQVVAHISILRWVPKMTSASRGDKSIHRLATLIGRLQQQPLPRTLLAP